MLSRTRIGNKSVLTVCFQYPDIVIPVMESIEALVKKCVSILKEMNKPYLDQSYSQLEVDIQCTCTIVSQFIVVLFRPLIHILLINRHVYRRIS
jgi:hypothetical protein